LRKIKEEDLKKMIETRKKNMKLENENRLKRGVLSGD